MQLLSSLPAHLFSAKIIPMNTSELFRLTEAAKLGQFQTKDPPSMDMAMTLFRYNLGRIVTKPDECRDTTGSSGVFLGDTIQVLPNIRYMLQAIDVVLGSNVIENMAHSLESSLKNIQTQLDGAPRTIYMMGEDGTLKMGWETINQTGKPAVK